ncbi:hypothetical protein Cni_G10384 [Canna indica]|uniref:Uncharacterized protein n=1 Tax=Canna indica TaxID=4628 RepID=A0AAQ3K7L9_9LILI|nr:hypothetical protein Cni_G10384 [Canna indica]
MKKKLERIQESAKGRVFIIEEDLAKARNNRKKEERTRNEMMKPDEERQAAMNEHVMFVDAAWKGEMEAGYDFVITDVEKK